MASIVKRGDSPYWWVKFIDQDTGKQRFQSTGYRRDDLALTMKARALRSELTARELVKKTHNQGERWEGWVEPFLKEHCASPGTLERYLGAWNYLLAYLREEHIAMPCLLTYTKAQGYLAWRTTQKKRSGKTVKRNTAITDMKILSIVMNEAVKRGYAKTNTCEKMKLRRDKAKEKPSLTDQDITDIRAALKRRPPWMRVSFEIALYTGCRQSETKIAFKDIDFKRKTIRFIEPKGGEEKTYVVELPDELIPVLLPLKEAGQKYTLKGVPDPLGHVWWEFFSRTMKRPDLCFHCTRVNFVTRHVLASTPEPKIRRLVNHSSEMVNRIYQRLGVDDVRNLTPKLAIPSA
jgi:integrase